MHWFYRAWQMMQHHTSLLPNQHALQTTLGPFFSTTSTYNTLHLSCSQYPFDFALISIIFFHKGKAPLWFITHGNRTHSLTPASLPSVSWIWSIEWLLMAWLMANWDWLICPIYLLGIKGKKTTWMFTNL
jgi:hypothetical protein